MNNNRFLLFILNFLQLFMQLCVAVTSVNFILHGFMRYESFKSFNTLYIGIVVTLYYLVKTFIKNGRLAYVMHLAAALSVLFVVDGVFEDKVLVFVPAILLMYYSMRRKSEAPAILFDMGILTACYVGGFTISAESATIIPFYAMLMYVIAYMIWYNISNLNKMVSENTRVKSFNAQQSVSVNSVMITIFIMVCIVVMAIASRLRLEGILWGFLNILWQLLLGFFSLFKIKILENSQQIEMKIIEHTNSSASRELIPGMDMEMSNDALILNIIAGLFAAVILVFIIVMLIKAVCNFKYYKKSQNDVREFIKPEFSKNVIKIFRKPLVFDVVKGNGEKIRKIYRKLIKSNSPGNVKPSMTDVPEDISRANIGWDENARDITHIYEKARYGNLEIADEEVEAMRNKAADCMSKFYL